MTDCYFKSDRPLVAKQPTDTTCLFFTKRIIYRSICEVFLLSLQSIIILNMPTKLHPSPVFGPIHSRRLGVSLGINLLPADGKVCTFDCLYCECGLNKERVPHSKFPSRQEVHDALEQRLQEMTVDGPVPDVITFSGNGEPTLHPDFPDVIDDTIALRDKYFPDAKISVLTNSTRIFRIEIFNALMKVDNNILKLDTVNNSFIREVDRPVDMYYSADIMVRQMARFEGHCIIQTMFLQGEVNGKSVANVSDKYVRPWLTALSKIAPKQVMIYTIDRDTPVETLQKATPEQLDRIASLVRANGIDCSVSY